MMKRKIYDIMSHWKSRSNGKSALLVEGAHCVGKSYIVELFAKQEYKSYILIDFSTASNEILDLFTNESPDPDFFFAKLSDYYSTILYSRQSLIILDEVQQFPKVRQLIKYLVADGRYDFIETGSLVRLKTNMADIIIPSQEEYEEHIEMFPMDFEEFLWAMGDEVTVPMIRKCFEEKRPLGQAVHRKIMNDFRQYMLVGGMPQSVLAYAEGNDFAASDESKRRILQLYRRDISGFAAGCEKRVGAVFDGILTQLSGKEKKYRLASLGKNARSRSCEA